MKEDSAVAESFFDINCAGCLIDRQSFKKAKKETDFARIYKNAASFAWHADLPRVTTFLRFFNLHEKQKAIHKDV